MFKGFKSAIPLTAVVATWAMGVTADSLDRVGPKKLDKPSSAKAVAEAGGAAAEPSTAPSSLGTITGIVVVKSREEIKATGEITMTGLQVGMDAELSPLRDSEISDRLKWYIGKPLSDANLKALQNEVIRHYRSKNYPLVSVTAPPQESVGKGVVQVLVVQAKLGSVSVEGNKWYRSELFTGNVSLKPGDPIDMGKLMPDVEWLNQNPGRSVDVAFRPGKEVGQSDVVLQVEDHFPLHPFVGYENSGPRFAGENRVYAGLNWYDVFGWDQRLNYQYTTDYEFRFLHAHSMSYEIPLPWRHNLTFYGGYIDSRGDFPASSGLSQRGTTYQVSMRYEIPLASFGSYRHDLSFGFDYKRSNSNLEFGGIQANTGTPYTIAQFAALYKSSLPDACGSTSFRGEGYFSPGGITGSNSDAAFSAQRPGTRADYVYGILTILRETQLPLGLTWNVKLQGQAASRALQATEEFGMGGATTVRGFTERAANGDNAILASTEIVSPSFPLFGNLMADARDRAQVLAFYDHGEVYHFNPQVFEHGHIVLSSVGAGVRYIVRKNVSVRADYGWRVGEYNNNDPVHGVPEKHGHFNIAAMLSF